MCLPVQDWVSLRTSVLGDEVRNVKLWFITCE
jgi:hypothetical protein